MVTSAGVYAFVEWAGMNDKIAPLVAAAAAIPFTYVLSRRILAREHAPEAHAPAQPAPVPTDSRY